MYEFDITNSYLWIYNFISRWLLVDHVYMRSSSYDVWMWMGRQFYKKKLSPYVFL